MLKETIKCSITIQIQLIFRNHFKVLVLGVKKTSQHKNASVVGLQHMRDLKIFSAQKQTDRSVIAVIVFFQKKKKIFLRWFKIIAQYTVYIHSTIPFGKHSFKV